MQAHPKVLTEDSDLESSGSLAGACPPRLPWPQHSGLLVPVRSHEARVLAPGMRRLWSSRPGLVWTLDVNCGLLRPGRLSGSPSRCALRSAEDSGHALAPTWSRPWQDKTGLPATVGTLPLPRHCAHSRLHQPDGPRAGESAPAWPVRARGTSLSLPEPEPAPCTSAPQAPGTTAWSRHSRGRRRL